MMKISTEDVENVLLQIFLDLRIPVNGRLHQSVLTKHWLQYRFRGGDLSDALGRLISAQAVIPENTEEGLVLVLTSSGYARAGDRAHHGLRHWRNALRLSWLFFARLGSSTGSRVRRSSRRAGRSTDRGTAQLAARSRTAQRR